jgi:hypothetical protein
MSSHVTYSSRQVGHRHVPPDDWSMSTSGEVFHGCLKCPVAVPVPSSALQPCRPTGCFYSQSISCCHILADECELPADGSP